MSNFRSHAEEIEAVSVEAKPVDAVGQKLLEAAQILRERGWCQLALRDESGRVCALVAICYAAPPLHWPEMIARVERSLAAQFPEWAGKSIPLWNNAVGRTAEEIIGVLTSAAYLP